MVIGLKVFFLVLAIMFFALGAFFNFFVTPENRFSRFNMIAIGLFFYAAKDIVA